MSTSGNSNAVVTTIGIDIGKNSVHLAGLDSGGALVLRRKLSRGQIETFLANSQSCLIGLEARPVHTLGQEQTFRAT